MTLEPGPPDASRGADGSPASDPALRPEACVYAGERVRTAAELGAGWAALTTHRLLVYDPTAVGKRYVAVDRPNVTDVDVGTTGGDDWLGYAPQLLFYGVASLVVSFVVRAIDFGSSTQIPRSSLSGMESLLSMFDLLVTGLEVLAGGLLVAAFVFVVAGVTAVGLYLHAREPALVVSRAGSDPIRVPAPRHVARDAAATLRVQLDVGDPSTGVRGVLADAVDWPGSES